MATSSNSTVSLAYVLETVIGTTPATPTFKQIPHKSASLNYDLTKISDDHKTPDNMSRAPAVGGYKVSGDIGFNLQSAQFDDLILAAVMGSAWTTNVAKMGNTRYGFSFEQQDAAQAAYILYKGCQVNSAKISVEPSKLVECTLGVIGLAVETNAATKATTTTAILNNTNMTGSVGGSLTIDGATAAVTAIDINIENGIDTYQVVGQQASAGSFNGKKKVSGSMTVVADANVISLMQKHTNNTKMAVVFSVGDGTKSYTFTLPACYTTKLDSSADGDGIRVIKVEYEAVYDATLGTIMSVTRTV
jgi:hypothetical protein